MSADFSFSDFKRVLWVPTLKLTLARGFFSGILWTVLISLTSQAPAPSQVLSMPFIWTVAALPLALFTQFIGMFFGAITSLARSLIHLLGSLVICAGDPIIYLINKFIPGLFNIGDLSVINFRPIIFVTSEN